MDTHTDDERLRRIYNESTPVVSDAAFARHVKETARRRHPKRFGTTHPRRRIVLASLAAVVVLAAAAYGINLLVAQLGQNDGILVITDAGIGGQGSVDPSVETAAGTLTGVKAELWMEIQRIREGVAFGELVLDWTAAEAEPWGLPSDPMLMLGFLEELLLRPDITVYLLGSAGETTAFRTEVAAMPGVEKVEFISKEDALQRLEEDFADNPEVIADLPNNPLPDCVEVWLTDYTQAESLADEWSSRPGVDAAEVGVPSTVDYAYWLARLRSLTHSSDSMGVTADAGNGSGGTGGETVTTYGTAPATGEPPLSSTTTIMGVGPILGWGEEAVLDGRTIRVERPIEIPGLPGPAITRPQSQAQVPDETGALSGSTPTYVAYSLVTITNTGSEPLTCVAQEFLLMGNHSGSTGVGHPENKLAGHEVLDSVTLQPGEWVTRAVPFNLTEGDHPVKVLLGMRLPTGNIYGSTSEWLACWQ